MVKGVKKFFVIGFFLVLFSFNFIYASTLETFEQNLKEIQEDVDKVDSLFTDKEFRMEYLNQSWKNFLGNNSEVVVGMEVTENWVCFFNPLWRFLFGLNFGFNFEFFLVFILFFLFLYFFFDLSFCIVELTPFIRKAEKLIKSLIKYSLVVLFFFVFSYFNLYLKIVSLFERWVVFFSHFHFTLAVFFSIMVLIVIFILVDSLIGILKKRVRKKLEILDTAKEVVEENEEKKEEGEKEEEEDKEEVLKEVVKGESKEDLIKMQAKKALSSTDESLKQIDLD